MKVTVEDIVDRLWHRKRYWHGPDPTITVTGKPGSFGELVFHFVENGKPFPVGWHIFIHHKEDLQEIRRNAEEAIRNYDVHVNMRGF